MNKLYLGGFFLIVFSFTCHIATATPITYSDTQMQTIKGQNFSFIQTPLAAAAVGATADFVITARGNYTPQTRREKMKSWNIDGVVFRENWRPNNADSYEEVDGSDDVIWSRGVTLSAADLQFITADGIMTIHMDLSNAVSMLSGYSGQFVSYSLTYDAVYANPEPATIALLGIGLIGLGGIAVRRRFKRVKK